MITEQTLSTWVSIGITTKNRWHDLKITLEKLVQIKLRTLPILIIDDGSDEPCPFNLNGFPLNIQLQRFTSSKGLIVRRNQLARAMQTKYYLSLDDDSFPVSGSLLEAVTFAESRSDLFCLAFPVYNPVMGVYQSQSRQKTPYQVRHFIGCGHLIHRPHFLNLGGYREELVHQGEEMEIAARAFQRGLYCYHFPGFEIHHVASNSGRNWQRMDFYGARNNVLWNDWFVPQSLKPVKQSRTLVSRVLHSIKVGRLGQIRGELAGLSAIPKYKDKRESMSLEQFLQWQHLPES